MGELLYFAETSLLWMVSVFFLAGIVTRSLFFVFNILRPRPFGRRGLMNPFVTLVGALVPFHRAALKKPVYAAIRHAFHACLFILPIWFSGHVYLWEESRFEWYWTPLPDEWADRMTLFVLITCTFFIGRHIVSKEQRLNAKISDFLLILITGLPFLTGYFLTHGNLNSIPFFDTYLWYIHVISAEIMLVMIVFLFCRTRLRKETCVGCAACVENCPTNTLDFSDNDAVRIFKYSHYQCICCGSCVNVCPENAATLSHAISIKHFLRVFSKYVIRDVELAKCDRCGATIAPEPQMTKLEGKIAASDVEMTLLNCCDRCKKMIGRNSAPLMTVWDSIGGSHLGK
ncbi:MAG: 4Fe-4S dicluster domain-containing protein [Desulfobacterales bacterium]|jgi:ferredoxin